MATNQQIKRLINEIVNACFKAKSKHFVANLLQCLYVKNILRFDKVIAKIKWCNFLPHSIVFKYPDVQCKYFMSLTRGT